MIFVKREGFVLPLALIFLLFSIVVSVFLSATSNNLFATSRDLDEELFEKYEKLAFISTVNTWNGILNKEYPNEWENAFHHVLPEKSTRTKISFENPFFEIKSNNFDSFKIDIASTSAYHGKEPEEPFQFTIEFSSSSSPSNNNIGESLAVTFTNE